MPSRRHIGPQCRPTTSLVYITHQTMRVASLTDSGTSQTFRIIRTRRRWGGVCLRSQICNMSRGGKTLTVIILTFTLLLPLTLNPNRLPGLYTGCYTGHSPNLHSHFITNHKHNPHPLSCRSSLPSTPQRTPRIGIFAADLNTPIDALTLTPYLPRDDDA